MSWHRFDVWSVYAMALGQGLFVAMWAVLPWWRAWIGRAMMLKSTALLLVLTMTSIALYWGPADWQPWAMRVGRILVLAGIWAQAAALRYEEVRARAEERDPLHQEG